MPDISHVILGGRPVIVCDVDDVVLKFIEPFERFLNAQSLRFVPRSFRLNGNIERYDSGKAIDDSQIGTLLQNFFEAQQEWQTPVEAALSALVELQEHAEIVFLTAMPPEFYPHRRALLDEYGLHYPMVATQKPKGPVAARILNGSGVKCAFIDDMAHNVDSVAEHLPDCLAIHMPPDYEVHRMAPATTNKNAHKASGWAAATPQILRYFDVK